MITLETKVGTVNLADLGVVDQVVHTCRNSGGHAVPSSRAIPLAELALDVIVLFSFR